MLATRVPGHVLAASKPLPCSRYVYVAARKHRSLQSRVITTATPGQDPQATTSPAEELPPWVRREKERELQAKEGSSGLPWPLYLLFSTFVAIAAVGSISEFLYKNPIFGVIQPENPIWAPILLGMGITGWPTAGFLFYKGVSGFNADAEKQDKLDGYM